MRIGIAGYMGAGKSTRARSFASEYAAVIDADARAKAFMAECRAIRDGLRRAFGDAVVDDSGELRFDVLGKSAFASIETLRTFNGVVHPPLVKHLERLVFDCDKPVCVLDAALIPLWGDTERWFDLRVWIDAPFEERYRRLRAKLVGMEDAELIRRMRLQEEVMEAPSGDLWVRLTDDKCQAYILDRLRESAQDMGVVEALSRSVLKC